MAGVLDGFSFATAAEKQLTDNKNTVKSIAFWLSVWKVVFREGNCQGNRKLRTDSD